MREVVDRVVESTGLSREAVETVLKATFAVIAEGIRRGEAVRLWGFGTFEVMTVRGRAGWDFGRGKVLRGLVSRRVRFRAGSAIARALKEER